MLINPDQPELIKFREVVLEHIKNSLSHEKWLELRAYTAENFEEDTGVSFEISDEELLIDDPYAYDSNHTPEDIVQLSLIDNSVSIEDFLGPFGERAVHITDIGQYQVYCVLSMGYYFIGEPNGPYVWSIDVTFPASHPPGW